jgi:DNA-binding ferritin-like protein
MEQAKGPIEASVEMNSDPDRVVATINSIPEYMAGDLIETAEAADDRGTANLLDELRDGVEKDIWMLQTWQKESAKSWG